MSGTIHTFNPATGQALRTYITFSPEQIENAVARAGDAQSAWAARGIQTGMALLRRIAEVLRRDADSLARLASTSRARRRSRGRGVPDPRDRRE